MSDPFTILRAGAIPLLRPNIDTDSISPGTLPPRKRAAGTEFSEHGSSTLADDLFANWRYDGDGEPRADFVFNQPRFAGARILLTGANFGCGSSRESAVWMLAAWGIRCVVAPSFAEIFESNCYANGVLPIALPAETIAELASEAEALGASGTFIVDLDRQSLTAPSGRAIAFHISGFRRRGLLAGLDEIEVTLEQTAGIDAYLAANRAARPWIYAPDSH
ncbi:MAG TPA: 3-isopropylmalate dehydratase small subunit [Sphingomonadaceae bacterium]|nr:3-isopropylmalate dehydratase small subunit [Sphingomonadaceae bacterium]